MSLSHRQRPRFANSDPRRHLRPTKPAAPNTRSPRRSHPERPKPAPGSSLNRRPVPNPQIRSSSGGKFHIDRHQRRCELPPRFPPSRLFGRLPPCTPSRLCLAGVRKPLTKAVLPVIRSSWRRGLEFVGGGLDGGGSAHRITRRRIVDRNGSDPGQQAEVERTPEEIARRVIRVRSARWPIRELGMIGSAEAMI
jgi:hypothetical protein